MRGAYKVRLRKTSKGMSKHNWMCILVQLLDGLIGPTSVGSTMDARCNQHVLQIILIRMLNINIRINLICINLIDQLNPYDLRIILMHTQHKCEESVKAVLAFLKNVECTSSNVGCT